MFLWMFAFNCGVILLYFFAVLPAAFLNIALIVIAGICLLHNKLRILAVLIFGYTYAAYDAADFLNARWPESQHGATVELIGYACSLPEVSAEKLVFDFCAESLVHQSSKETVKTKFRASFYSSPVSITPYTQDPAKNGFTKELNSLSSGTVKLSAKVRSPRGSVNFYGGLYETWLYANQYHGIATVNAISLASSVCDWFCELSMYRIALRAKLKSVTEGYASANFLSAITLGDRSGFTADDWTVMANTGTTHLVAISGMHMSFIGVLIFGLLFRSSRLVVRLMTAVPGKYDAARLMAIAASLVCGLLYVLLSGAAIPVQRAYIMFAVALVFIGYFRFNAYSVLSVALFCVLVIAPGAVLQPATWLSFGAVFVLSVLFAKRIAAQGVLYTSLKMNAGIFLSMFGLLTFLGLPVAWTSPFVNIVAVPAVIFLLLPIGVLLFVMVIIESPGTALLLEVFDTLFQQYWWLLTWFSESGWVTQASISKEVSLGLLLIGCVNLLPIGFLVRCVSCAIFFLIYNFSPLNNPTPLLVNVLDVGQGTSVLIQNEHHSVLYDFGPAYGVLADAGERVIVPQLQAQGLYNVDTAFVSHNDLDHRGGFESVRQKIKFNSLLAGQPDYLQPKPTDCRSVSSIEMRGLTIEFLWPQEGKAVNGLSPRLLQLSNNQSCVLKLLIDGMSVLITGDVDADIERWLVTRYGEKLQSDVLIVGHHGSATSSSWAFLKTVRPKVAIYSAAYKGRFGHPAKTVDERFQRLGIPTYNTATSGAIGLQTVSLNPFNFGNGRKTASVAGLQSPPEVFTSFGGQRVEVLEARRQRALFWLAD
ncbi:MAG: DNA internalization-related competence protein ComEC/Rec2 [Hahellaceae bacterium]|nr:DNA internalization-related competence protein ComEC/Rec2 [Hahellaceae bacterium]MCP5212939.1 DNA internalization-related competence protein ComEC/Rec2 [Hahellaceae bacterium]